MPYTLYRASCARVLENSVAMAKTTAVGIGTFSETGNWPTAHCLLPTAY